MEGGRQAGMDEWMEGRREGGWVGVTSKPSAVDSRAKKKLEWYMTRLPDSSSS